MTYNLFISHKHADSQIARVIAGFIETKSLGQVVAHVSSDPAYQGPRFGKNLNQQLCRALLNTQVLILIYTSADEDWSYCMFECGVATDPESPRTNIIVFQCGREVPKPFEDQLRVNVRTLDNIRKFSKAFFRDPTFFPGATTALAPTFSDSQCYGAADELFDALAMPGVLPDIDDKLPEDVAAWPLLQLEVSAGSVDAIISNARHAQSLADCEKMLLEEAVIINSDNSAPLVFGVRSLPLNMLFGSLVKTFTQQSPEPKPAWVSSCIAQVLAVSKRQLAAIRWASFRESDGPRSYTPIVSRMRRLPSPGKVQFDLHFLDLDNPRSIDVSTRMINLADVYRKCLDDATSNMKLAALRNEMANLNKERLPILTEDDRPLFMVHRSTLERYLLDQALEGKNMDDLTVRDLLDASEGAFATAFATVSRSASLADAQQAMVGNIRDVFVTDDGTRNKPVLGWLTNVDLTRIL
jgi:hypothetical protein